MSINSLSSFLAQPRTLEIEPRPPRERTAEAMKAAYLVEHPLLTPQQAFASGAELGPPSDDPRADNHASKIHTEIKINGKVIARTYNSGAVEIASEYRFLSEELDFGADTMVGPDLAANRAARINAALERYGAVTKDELSPSDLIAATLAKKPILESLLADTVQTQQEWLDEMEKQGRLDPGALFSRVA
jgi:hypothetical protein